MSRTYRNPYIPNLCLRTPQTLNQVKQLQKAVDEIKELGFNPNNRTTARGNYNSKHIPNAWDDIPVAALTEIDYAKGIVWET